MTTACGVSGGLGAHAERLHGEDDWHAATALCALNYLSPLQSTSHSARCAQTLPLPPLTHRAPPRSPVHISAAAPPEELFRPLLDAAFTRGVGLAAPAGAGAGAPSEGGELGYAEKAMLAEEVLVLQRAASRLAEMTGGR
jgi:hypothetical protein